MSDKIIYPSINLFLYDLKDGLGQDEAKIDQNCQQFCKKIYSDLDEKAFQEKCQQFQKYKTINADVIELLETRWRTFPSPLDGYYYPLQLGDTYALQVNNSGKFDADGKFNDDEQDIDDKPFTQLKQEIIQRLSQQSGTIGQTWLLWGKLASANSDIDKIAKDCYTQIVSNYNWDRDFIGKGNLLGGTVFELWYRPENLGLTAKDFWETFRQESHHAIIWIFPNNQSADDMRKQVQKLYEDLIGLFHYRHKIVWAYYQSHDHKSILKREYVKIQPCIHQTIQLPRQLQTKSLKLNQLQQTLTNNLINLSDYTIALNYLENQNRTIQINLENYKTRLAGMNQKYVGSDLKLLELFSESEIYARKYQRQIEADYANLSPGLTLLQNLNSTIQGIIDLEQTKSDRALDNTIAMTTIGLAISGLTLTVATSDKYSPGKSYNDFSFLVSPPFVWSMSFSVPFLLVLIFRLFRR